MDILKFFLFFLIAVTVVFGYPSNEALKKLKKGRPEGLTRPKRQFGGFSGANAFASANAFGGGGGYPGGYGGGYPGLGGGFGGGFGGASAGANAFASGGGFGK